MSKANDGRGRTQPATVWISVFASVVASVIASVLIISLTSTPKVGTAGATDFLNSYYSKVMDASVDKRSLWEGALSPAFRSYEQHSFPAFEKFYSEQIKAVKVVNISPGEGTNQFVVSLQFTGAKAKAASKAESFVFYLKCNDSLARLPSIECSTDKIQIDVTVSTK